MKSLIFNKTLKKHCRTIRIFSLFIVFCVLFSLGYDFARVQGPSMDPTYRDNEWVVIDRWTYRFFMPEKGDVILVKDPLSKDILMKRVMAKPGDTIEVKKGYIYVNDARISDKFKEERIRIIYVDDDDVPLTYWDGPNAGETVTEYLSHNSDKLGKGEYWVIGDNRKDSWYGIVKLKDIKGKLWF